MIEGVDLAVPPLEEVERMLLDAADRRIEACNRLKEHIRATNGPVTKDRIRDWRKRAKTDGMSEKYLRTCRDLYGRILEAGTM